MRDILPDIQRLRAAGVPLAVARVVQVEGSGPREPGATMLVTSEGEVVGSVSGGCVEGAVVSESLSLIESGRPKLLRFGYSDDEAFAVGLTCGGIITIFSSPLLPQITDDFVAAVEAGEPCALATVIAIEDSVEASALEGRSGANECIIDDRALDQMTTLGATILIRADGAIIGSLGDGAIDALVGRDAEGAIASGRSSVRHYARRGATPGEGLSVFLESFTPSPKMLIFGAVDFTAALVRVAKVLGFEVTVCDARAPFATNRRFPEADRVVVDWPGRYLDSVAATLGERDAICVLTHDPKFDVPAIVAALNSSAGYIGAMGSRRTHRERTARLREVGVTDEGLARVMSPIGLDLGARTPEETAIAIVAEIISRQTGHQPSSLRDGDGPIHGHLTEVATPV